MASYYWDKSFDRLDSQRMKTRSIVTSLALGGLLHDIGKFRERAGLPASVSGGRYSHEPHSHAFVEALSNAFSEPDRLKAMALGDHEPQCTDEKIVAIADRLASSERVTSAPGELAATGRKNRPLLSLLTRVYGHTTDAGRVPLGALAFDRASLFPGASDPDETAYARLWSEFENEAARITRIDDVETWLYLLQKYTWCMPSSARAEEVPDVSLFDHARATAALAVCIGAAYADDECTLNRLLSGSSETGGTPVAILARMDVRGIQAFLYSLTAKGAAKSLRGRSFYIGLLCDAVVRRVLADLELPVTQTLYAGGGHAYLLLPPTDADRLASLRAEIERAIFLLHGGDLSVSIGWTVLTDSDLRGGTLSVKWDEAARACNDDRARPMASQDPQWLAEHVFAPQEQGGLAGRCEICQAELGDGDDAKCSLCESFEDLGRRLRNARKLAMQSVAPKAEPERARSWHDAVRSLGLRVTLDGTGDTVFDLRNTDFLPEQPARDMSYGFRPMTQVFPYETTKQPSEADQPMEGSSREGTGHLLEFGDLAGQAKGVKRLAALRMDVDNLGRLFREGLGRDMATLSRVAALSSQIRWFFEGYLNSICGEWPDLVYGLYSGGDDLFFVGAWHVMPLLAQKISDEFRAYCGENPGISVSAGISLFPDKYPLYQAADDSADALDASKAGQKNAITFLRRTVSWTEWPAVVEAKKRLEDMARREGPRAILQYLRRLDAMCEWDRRHRKTPTQRWRWIAAYMLARMAERYKDDREALKGLGAEIRDEGALRRWALAARWVQLEQRERADKDR